MSEETAFPEVRTPTGQTLRVGTIYCIGRNFALHAREMQAEVPANPVIFSKSAAAFTQKDRILIPEGFDVHHELEIVALVGRRGSPATVDEASRWVAGLALGIDFTLRDLQADCKAKGLPWFRAKSFRQSAFASPFLSPESPVWSEPFWLEKNGERVQEGERRQMLFSIPALIHEIGIIHALYPGDLIYTGTPQGVGSVNAGDRLRLGIGDRLLSTVSIDIAPVK